MGVLLDSIAKRKPPTAAEGANNQELRHFFKTGAVR
jgi:hypothetical protein